MGSRITTIPAPGIRSINGVVGEGQNIEIVSSDGSVEISEDLLTKTIDLEVNVVRTDYITNSDFEVDTSGWNLYNDAGRTTPAFVVDQDLTFTSALSGDSGNGVQIEYIYNAAFPSSTPNINVISSTHVQVQWNNGPTVANNPTATQLTTAWNAVPAAVAIATVAITGTSTKLQYITGVSTLGNGGDTSPVDGTGGVVTGVTFTRNTTTPLVGVASGDLGKDAANREGTGVSTDFAIDSLDRGKILQISFAYEGSSGIVLGTSSDVRVFMYDITNAALIPVVPRTTLKGPVNTATIFTGTFQSVGTSFNYRLILHIATQSATAWDLLLDSVSVSSTISPTAPTQVESVVIPSQAISGSVTDHMAVAWTDGASAWVPATSAWNGDYWSMLGFATNIVGSTADIFVHGYMDGFSFGPFSGYNQYVDPAVPGGLTPLPSPFTDTYVIMGKAISATAINIQVFKGKDLVTSKGGLLSNDGQNDGDGDEVLSVGTDGNVLVARSASLLGLAWQPAVVTAAPFSYTTATRTLAFTSQTANFFLAAPNGGSGTPTFRAVVAADVPTLNQNTTGSAAKWTTARTLAGNSVDGTANVPFSNKFIAQGTVDAGLSGAQFLGALGTGILKNTTTSGVLSIAAASDVTGALITGFVSGAGTVAATDTILQAINKLNGNIALKAPLASPVFTGDVNASTGNLLVSTIGKGLQVKTGTNAKIGTAVLVAGTKTVANTSVTANSLIFLTSQVDGGTPGFVRVTAKTAATSFVITSSNPLDTSTVAWMIVETL